VTKRHRSAALLVAVALCCFAVACGVALRDPVAKRVIIEGVVIPGETWRVDPVEESELAGAAGLPATVSIESPAGERASVACDENGRFRLGPVALSGAEGELLLVTCPGRRGLCLSAPIAMSDEAADGPAPPVVRYRISLPLLPAPAAQEAVRASG
jgi:hypothetical protein